MSHCPWCHTNVVANGRDDKGKDTAKTFANHVLNQCRKVPEGIKAAYRSPYP